MIITKKIKLNLFDNFKLLIKNKVFRLAIIINLIYVILTSILTLVFFYSQNDFLVYYNTGGKILNDINNLYTYNPELSWQFRYFPLSALFFIPFYLIGFEAGFICLQVLNFCINILICIFIYKIIVLIRGKDFFLKNNRIIIYISVFLISAPQFYNYILGQVNLFITILILISLYIYLKKESFIWQFIAGIMLGITINLKPIAIFIIPFLIVIEYNHEIKKFYLKIKQSFIRLLGVFIPLFFNLILFIIYPTLLKGFIDTNISGEDPVDINQSFSLTKIIINIIDFIGSAFNQLVIITIVFALFFSVSIIIYVFRKNTKNSLVIGYTLGIVIMLLIYFDSWDHHLLILIPILIILISNLDQKENLRKYYFLPAFFFLNFITLLFLGIYYLLKDIFPFNFVPTIFLIVILFGIYQYLLKNNNMKPNKKK
ncbi:MAG: DUF2029 domain-containing protein [Candidatus Lokiarchaeota archaeon]|nr:DUF2029 domain-containing protein [Candidatus Lokiarchaeota archaeon]